MKDFVDATAFNSAENTADGRFAGTGKGAKVR
jgi:hypothetical protein